MPQKRDYHPSFESGQFGATLQLGGLLNYDGKQKHMIGTAVWPRMDALIGLVVKATALGLCAQLISQTAQLYLHLVWWTIKKFDRKCLWPQKQTQMRAIPLSACQMDKLCRMRNE